RSEFDGDRQHRGVEREISRNSESCRHGHRTSAGQKDHQRISNGCAFTAGSTRRRDRRNARSQSRPADRAALAARDTTVPAAKEAFLQARGYFQNYDRPENVDHAIALLDEALRLDANYAAAAAAKGEAYWRKFESTKDPKWIDAATNECQRAIRADDK